jgi:hypothetical protein
MTMARPKRSEGPEGRPTRTPIGERNVLTAPKDLIEKDFDYRFVNDDDHGDRLSKFKAAGWEPVQDKTQVGDANVGQASQFGVAGKPVGGGKKAVLMKIPSNWYQEDQAAKEAQIKSNLQGVMRDESGQIPEKSNLYEQRINISSNESMPVIQD